MVRRYNKPDKTGLSVFFQSEMVADSTGCMTMQPGKIYQARFRCFSGF